MTDGTTRRYNDGEVLSGVQRRRRWTPEEKVRIVEETYLPGMSVSLVARRHGIGGNQIFTWRRLMAQGALTAATTGEEVVPASKDRALEAQCANYTCCSARRPWRTSCSARPCPGPQAQKTYGPPRPQDDFEWHDGSASTYQVSRIFAPAKMGSARSDPNKLRGAEHHIFGQDFETPVRPLCHLLPPSQTS